MNEKQNLDLSSFVHCAPEILHTKIEIQYLKIDVKMANCQHGPVEVGSSILQAI